MDIQQVYNSFQSEWIDKRVDYDKIYNFQCVDLIRQYWYEKFGIGNAAGGVDNATDYANPSTVPQGLLGKFQLLNTSQVQVGDVVVLNINHIGIANGIQDSATFQMLDQNGGTLHNGDGVGDDAIRIHTFNKVHIMGVLRPIPVPVGPPYTVEQIPHKQVILNNDTFRWNVSYGNYDDIFRNPLAGATKGSRFFTSQILHHQDGHSYYVQEDNGFSQPNGFDVTDCDDYVAPPPVSYVPPAGASTALPAEKLTLLTTLRYYGSAEDAQNDKRAVTTIPEGTYYVFKKEGIYWDLTTDNMKDQSKWINTLDNKKAIPVVVAKPAAIILPDPPTPVKTILPSDVKVSGANDTAWKATYKPFHPDNHSDVYELLQDVRMVDYSGQRPYIIMRTRTRINITGTFEKSGVTFYRARANNDVAYSFWYGISLYNDDSQPNIKKEVTPPEAVEQRIGDILYYLRQDIRKWWDVKLRRK